MSLETFHTAENPLPEIIGIRTVAEKILALPQSLIPESLRQQWKLLINENGGWQQNSIQSAYLGLTDEAKRMVVESFSN